MHQNHKASIELKEIFDLFFPTVFVAYFLLISFSDGDNNNGNNNNHSSDYYSVEEVHLKNFPN